jgi:hypothetical protein
MAKKQTDLVQLIRDNPDCHFEVDNDCWFMTREHPDKNPNDYADDELSYDRWNEDNVLCSSDDDIVTHGDGGYGSGNCYGGDILQALAKIVGITVESV